MPTHAMSAIRKTFLSNLMLIIGLNLLIKPLYVLVIEAKVQDRVGPEDFGVYFALLNLSFIFNIIPDLGITNWNTRHVAVSGIVDAQRFNRLLGIRSLLALSYLIICFTIALSLHYDSKQISMLAVLGLNQILSTGLQFMRSYIAGMHRFSVDSLFSVLDRALLTVIMLAMLILQATANNFKIEYLIWGQTLAYGVAFGIALIYVSRHKKVNLTTPAQLSYRNIIQESAPYALLILLSMIANRQDGVLLERMHGNHSAGIYAMAYRLGDTLNMFSFLFAGLLLPLFTRQLSDRRSIQILFQSSIQLLTAGAGIVMIACFFHAEYLLQFIYTHHIQEAAEILPWVIISAFLFSQQYITGTLITATGRIRTLIIIAACGLIYNTVLNFLYIPHEGALGAAKAACFMQGVVWVAQCIEVQKHYQPFHRNLILRSLLFLSSSITAAYFIVASGWSNPMQLFSTVSATTLLAFAFKLIHVSEIRHALTPWDARNSDEVQKH